MTDEKRLTVKVPGELHKAAKVRAAQEGVVLSDLVRLWLADWLAGERPQPEQAPQPVAQAQT